MARSVFAPWTEELVARRAISLEPRGLVLSLTPKHPMLPAERNMLLLESVEAEATRIPGVLPIVEVLLERERVRVVTGKLDDRSMSLYTFLRALSSRDAIITLPFAEFLVHQVGDALARLSAHRPSGVFVPVHGLLRPAAIALEPGGKVTLVGGGFPGLTRLVTPPGRTGLEDRRLLPPERFAGAALSPAGDVYSMAAIVYEILVGAPYLQGINEAGLRERAARHAPPELPAGTPVQGELLVGLLASALAPSPEDRPADVASLASALTEAREAAGLPRWSRDTFAKLEQRVQAIGDKRGPSLLIGLRPSAPTAETPVSPSTSDRSITRDNLFDNLEMEPLARPAPPPPPPRSDPPPMEMPALSRSEANVLAEVLHVTDEMVQADRTVVPDGDKTPMIYGASMVLFGTALVLTLITLFLFLTS